MPVKTRQNFTFENQPTTVELTKTDLTTGKELPGAHLKVTDSDGNTVDEWTSTEESHDFYAPQLHGGNSHHP